MTLLEAAKDKGFSYITLGSKDEPADCPCTIGVETREQSETACETVKDCMECWRREVEFLTDDEREEVQPEQPGEEPEEKRYVEGLPYIEKMEEVTITKAGAAAEICIAESILLERLLKEVKNSGVEHAVAIQYLIGVNDLAEMVMRRLGEC